VVPSKLSVPKRLDRELRAQHYGALHLLLKYPLAEFVSSAPPQPRSALSATLDASACLTVNPLETQEALGSSSMSPSVGVLYVYDSPSGVTDHMNDGIEWETKKMNVKLIVRSSAECYKLKNCKNDVGEVVMRRQTWLERNGGCWRKNVYRLVRQDPYLETNTDGTLAMRQSNVFQPFPLLIHYFRKGRAKRKRAPSLHELPRSSRRECTSSSSSSCSSSSSFSSSVLSMPHIESGAGGPASATTAMPAPIKSHAGQAEQSSPLARSPSSSSSSQAESSVIPSLTTSSLPEEASRASCSSLFSSSESTVAKPPRVLCGSSSLTNLAVFSTVKVEDEDALGLLSPVKDEPVSLFLPLDSGASSTEVSSPMARTFEPFSSFDDVFLTDPGSPKFQPRDDTSVLHFASPADSIPLALPTPANVVSSGDRESAPLLEVRCYSPDSSFASVPSPVLLVLPSLSTALSAGRKEVIYSCRFGEQEVPAEEVSDGVIRFLTPSHQAGVVYFFVQRKCLTATGVQVQLSIPLPFYFLPSVGDGRVSLHLSHLRETERENLRRLISKFQNTISELDLSHNNLQRLDFLEGLHSLKSLVADNNTLFSNSPLPRLPQLTTLTVNANRILDLRSFISNVVACFPNLSYLSMLKNPADPYFKGAHHYFNFRVYVVSQLKHLRQLDATPVTLEEREHAKWINEVGPDT